MTACITFENGCAYYLFTWRRMQLPNIISESEYCSFKYTVAFFFFFNAGRLKIPVGKKPNFKKCQQCYHTVMATQIK